MPSELLKFIKLSETTDSPWQGRLQNVDKNDTEELLGEDTGRTVKELKPSLSLNLNHMPSLRPLRGNLCGLYDEHILRKGAVVSKCLQR